jgi:hypothetical protein
MRKEKLENATRNMSADPRPMNTAVRRRHSSSQTKMVEISQTQGKETVSNMQKLSNMEERKVLTIGKIADKQLQYFKIRDSETAVTQHGLVQAMNGLSVAIVQAYAKWSQARIGGDEPTADQGDASELICFPRNASSTVPWDGQNYTYTDPLLVVNLGNDVNAQERNPHSESGVRANNVIDVPGEDSVGHVNVPAEELA